MVYNLCLPAVFPLNNTARISTGTGSRCAKKNPLDSYYETEYAGIEEQLDYFISPAGAEYSYVGWSYRQDRYRSLN